MAINKMKATILKDIDIVHRFETPHKYAIGNTGVTIDLRYQAWPSVITDEKGTVYAFISGRLQHIDPFGQTLMYTSNDNGETWSEPIIVNDTPMDDRDVGATYLGNGRIVITYFRIAAWDLIPNTITFTTADGVEVTGKKNPAKNDAGHYRDGYIAWMNEYHTTQEQRDAVIDYWKTMNYSELEGGNWCLVSEDYGKTWSAPRRTPVSSPHGMLQLKYGEKSGQLLYVGRGYGGIAGDAIYAYTSPDLGLTWEFLSVIGNGGKHILYCEPHAVELKNGRIVVAIRGQMWGSKTVDGVGYQAVGYDHDDKVLYRTFDENGEEQCFVLDENNVPTPVTSIAPKSNRTPHRTYYCHSDDHGKTWSEIKTVIANDPEGLEITNGRIYGCPPHLLEMPNGAIVLTYASRSWNIGERAIISYDFGETWDKDIILCDKPRDRDNGAGYLHGDIGYPATALMANGDLISVYYQAYTGDRYCSFLCTKWRLE